MEEVVETDAIQALEVVPHDILVQRAPEKVLAEAKQAATALQDVISKKKRPVIMNGEQYLEFEDWQTLGRFYGVTARISRTAPVMFNEAQGFEASADAIRADGMVISSADAMCLNDEPNWERKPAYQLRSMAQTRACAKALRNVLAWVVVLAGYKPTPAEEMSGVNGDRQEAKDDVPNCPECNGAMWDNRATKKGRQPDFKCKDKACNKAVWLDSESKKTELTQLKQAAVDQCKLLNEHGDEPQWTAKRLNEFAVQEYGLSADRLELEPMRELVKKLSLRYDELRKDRTEKPDDKQKREAMIDKIVNEFNEEDIDRHLAETYGPNTVIENLSLIQLVSLHDALIPF
jgi:hypothetical protein